MKSLLSVFGKAFDEVETYCDAQPPTDYLQRLFSKEHFIALAALKQGEVVGGLVAYELEKFEQARSEIYIYDLAVASAHRRQGIAIALIQALQKIAAQRGAYVIFVQADRGDEPAICLDKARCPRRRAALRYCGQEKQRVMAPCHRLKGFLLSRRLAPLVPQSDEFQLYLYGQSAVAQR